MRQNLTIENNRQKHNLYPVLFLFNKSKELGLFFVRHSLELSTVKRWIALGRAPECVSLAKVHLSVLFLVIEI